MAHTQDSDDHVQQDTRSAGLSTGRQILIGVTVAVIGAFATAFATGWAQHWFTHPKPPACPGDGCEGKDPKAEGCDDPKTVQPSGNNPAGLQVRYSPACKAVWGRITHGDPGDVVSVHVDGGSTHQAPIDYAHDKFTTMAAVGNGAFSVTVCAQHTTITAHHAAWRPYCIHATQASAWHSVADGALPPATPL